jgi:hypothetical protein
MIPVALISFARRYMDGERLNCKHFPALVALAVCYFGGLEEILKKTESYLVKHNLDL